MALSMRDLTEVARASLQLSEQSREDSARVEGFTRRISWASLCISIGFTIVAVASLAVATIALAG